MPPARALVVLALLLASTALVARADDDEPRATDLVERAEARLAQVQITASGPPDVVSSLTPDDVKLKVGFTRIRDFVLDRFCTSPGATPDGDATTESTSNFGPATFMFYFDQPHLTMFGRARSLDIARDLVRALVHDGAEAMIVSNAGRLSVVRELTADTGQLLDALDRLESDRTQWDFFAEQEDGRIGEVVEILNDNDDVHRAIAAARSYQRTERFIVDKNLRRLSLLVGRLADLPPPKAVLYFADTLRSNAGEHYLTFFGERLRRESPALGGIASDSFMGALPFDRVLNEASAHGVRFYPVLARGLVTPRDHNFMTSTALFQTQATPTSSSRIRFRDAQNTLTSLASETGGHAFVRGDPPKRIAERIRDDFSCVYVASFDPEGFALDSPLRIIVESLRKDVALRARGRIVLQSAEARLDSRLLGAFSLNRGDEFAPELQVDLIPTGFDDGRYGALLQVSVPGTNLPSSSWDLGASLIYRDRVREEISGRVTVSRPGVPIVLEHELTLRPGRNEIVAVAHETESDFVFSGHLLADWPEPNLQHAVGAVIALVQPTPGAFLRGERTRTSGSLARAGSGLVDGSRPTALLTLVCRGQRQDGSLSVERSLIGSTAVDFPLLLFELGDDDCAQVRDVIPAGTLGPGAYGYEIRVLRDGEPVHQASREFRVATPQP